MVDTIPSCPKPSLLRTQAIGSDNIVIKWMSANATSWDVMVSQTAITNWSDVNSNSFITLNSNPGTINNLLPNTEYYIYVKSKCSGNETSSWPAPLIVTTQCDAISNFPFSERFETSNSGQGPQCWNLPKSYVYNATRAYPCINSYQINTTPNVLQFYAPTNTSIYAVTPRINSELDQLQVSFVLLTSSISYYSEIEVGVISNPNYISTFKSIETIIPANTLICDYTVSLVNSPYQGTGNH